MNKIPTAEEFLKHKNYPLYTNNGGYGIIYATEAMIEFAELHVQAALEAAACKQEQKTDSDWEYKVIQSSILNAYSLENIK